MTRDACSQVTVGATQISFRFLLLLTMFLFLTVPIFSLFFLSKTHLTIDCSHFEPRSSSLQIQFFSYPPHPPFGILEVLQPVLPFSFFSRVH